MRVLQDNLREFCLHLVVGRQLSTPPQFSGQREHEFDDRFVEEDLLGLN